MSRNIKTREGYDYWDKLCAIPNYGFIHSHDNSRVLKVEGIGFWINQYDVQEVVDEAQTEINSLRYFNQKLKEALKDIVDDYSERFDIESPGTNPGIKFVIEQAIDVLEQSKCK